jgi:cysteinyl-tRNA synthetase
MLKIYNSLTRAKEPFVPLDPPRVRMYVCGMTVYDYCHLGHARVMVVFDLVQRWLRSSGYRLTYARNITDIDDKIIRRAAEKGEPIGTLTGRFIRYMGEDAAALGVQKPDIEPRATEHVADMLEMIRRLEERGFAYRAASGDVNFSVRKFPGYGRLSGRTLEDLRAGERVEVDAAKHDPLDFVLWKRAKEGEPFWRSPWGDGRPGWHIECSAMSVKLLGAHFDIHGGGQDLQFPHHENEIAQSEGALNDREGQRFVNYWMHNGFVGMDKEKMSKSLGNFITVRELLKRYDPEVVRFFVVRAHYRSPLSYSDPQMDDARHGLSRLYTALKGASLDAAIPDWDEPHGRRFRDAMDDDFNTPEAMAALFDLANEFNRTRSREHARQLRALGGLLGILQRDSQAYLQAKHESGFSDDAIRARIDARGAARKRRDYAEADRIRRELEDAGILLEDDPSGTTWRRG